MLMENDFILISSERDVTAGKVNVVHFSSPSQRGRSSRGGGGEEGAASVCSEGPDLCALLLTCCSLILIIITLPLSLIWTIKVVQVSNSNLYCSQVGGSRVGEKFGNCN